MLFRSSNVHLKSGVERPGPVANALNAGRRNARWARVRRAPPLCQFAPRRLFGSILTACELRLTARRGDSTPATMPYGNPTDRDPPRNVGGIDILPFPNRLLTVKTECHGMRIDHKESILVIASCALQKTQSIHLVTRAQNGRIPGTKCRHPPAAAN